MAQLHCVVVTPEATVLDELVDFVALPLFDGEIGIAPGRSPLIGRLGYGELRLVAGGQTRRFYIDAGFVQVANNEVSVLTNRAVPAASIDPAVAQEHLTQAMRLPQPLHQFGRIGTQRADSVEVEFQEASRILYQRLELRALG